MSFFNLRRGSPAAKSQSGASAPAESLDIVRKRAKHRLIGAALLVLMGVVGFPLLFDTQPRPVPVDIAIEIPSKTAVKPLVSAEPAVAVPVPENSPIKAGVNPAGTGAGTGSGIAPAIAAASAPTSAAPSAQPREPAPAAKPLAATASAPAPKPDDSERVKALLDGKPAPEVSATGEPRLVVQVGAYADAAKAREARLKVEKAGLKTYTQVVDTKDGKRTRVRVGPFTSKEEADKAVTRIKALDLPASILTL